MTQPLNLKREWRIGPRIGDPAGFGRVHEAASTDYPNAVAKFVPRDPGADREVLFGNDLAGVPNVVPIIESGETADDFVLIMPRADKSLQEHLNTCGGALPRLEAVAVLTDVAVALANLNGRVVHRDLKPANVLFLNDRWCLADFGIARYAEMSTAPETRKHMMTPAYAAPEQWRGQRATSATDVYAFGIMAFQLLTGALPFPGPYQHDFRDQHLHGEPPYLDGHPAPLATLIEECLLRAAESRPTPEDLLRRLERATKVASIGGLAALEQANRAEVARQGASDRAASAARSAAERHADLADAALRCLKRIGNTLRDTIMATAPRVSIKDESPNGGWRLALGEAELRFVGAEPTTLNGWESIAPFRIVAHAAIGVTTNPDSLGYKGRSHSLWYCDAKNDDQFAWYETAFWMVYGPGQSRAPRASIQPISKPPATDVGAALQGMGGSSFQVARPFTAITADDLDDFIDRWGGWFASGSEGRLASPMIMPEGRPEGSWRRR